VHREAVAEPGEVDAGEVDGGRTWTAVKDSKTHGQCGERLALAGVQRNKVIKTIVANPEPRIADAVSVIVQARRSQDLQTANR
jgi:hypothetical protein